MSIVWPYPVHSHYNCGSFHSNMGSSPVSGQGPSADKEQGQGPLCEMLCHIKPDLQSHLVLVSDSCERVYLNTFKILSNNNFCFCRNLRTSSAYVEYHRRILINHSTEKLLRSPTMDLIWCFFNVCWNCFNWCTCVMLWSDPCEQCEPHSGDDRDGSLRLERPRKSQEHDVPHPPRPLRRSDTQFTYSSSAAAKHFIFSSFHS